MRRRGRRARIRPQAPEEGTGKNLSGAGPHHPPGEATIDKNSLLLGIKYEAAKLGGVEGEPLRAIEEQLAAEVGGGWASDEGVVRGRNAVRREHGLPPLGEPDRPSPTAPARRRSFWRRLGGG